MPIQNYSVDEHLIRRLDEVERRLKNLETVPQANNTTLTDGALTVIDSSGASRTILGRNPDGAYCLESLDGSGARQVQVGQLPDGSYGLGVLDAAGNLVDLVKYVFSRGYGFVDTSESTTSTAWVDLATVGPEVTVDIGPRGLAQVTVGAYIGLNAGGDTGSTALFIDGVQTITDFVALSSGDTAHGIAASVQNTRLITGLTPGAHTFRVKYSTYGGVTTVNFSARSIQVVPL